ncbi:MAG: murein biosynthesis integral membrane protein MurJ [Candidatus Nanopelagicales bacterium]
MKVATDSTARPPSTVAANSRVMAAGTLLSRLTGLARDFALAAAIGSAVFSDLFALGNSLPNIVYILVVGGALNAVFIPQLVRHMREDPDGGDDFADRLITATLLILVALTLIALACAPWIVRVYATANYNDTQLQVAVTFAWLCLPQILFYGAYTMFSQVLNSRLYFAAPAFAPIVNNIVMVATAVVFIWMTASVALVDGQAVITGAPVVVLGIGTTVGVVLQALVLIPFLRAAGYRWRPRWGFRGYGLGKAGRLALWTIGLVVVNQVGFLVVVRLATGANILSGADGGLALYQRALLVFMLPQSIITISIVTAIFPRMSHNAGIGKLDTVAEQLNSGIRVVTALMTICAAYLVAFGAPLGLVFFNWYRNSAESAIYTGQTISVFALGLIPLALFYLFLRGWYAFENTKVPFVLTVVYNAIAIPLTIGLYYAAPASGKVLALALAYVLAYWLILPITWLSLKRRVPGMGRRREIAGIAGSMLMAAVAAFVGFMAASGVTHLRTEQFTFTVDKVTATIALLLGGLVTTCIYVALIRIFRPTDFHAALSPALNKLPTSIRAHR